MIFAACLVLMTAVVLLSRRVHRTVLAPWSIYTVVWLGLIGLHSLNWIHFTPISSQTWLMLLGSLGSYLAGAGLVFAVKPVAVAMSLPPRERWFSGVTFPRVRQFHAVITVMGLVGSVGYFLVVQRLYGLDTLLTNPGTIRSGQSTTEFIQMFFWWKFPFYMNWLAIGLGLAWILARGRLTPAWVYAALVVEVMVNLALVSRGQMLLVGFVAVFLLTARRRRIGAARQLLVLGVLVVALAAYFTVAGELLGKTSEYFVDAAGGYFGPKALRPLGEFYIYVAGNIPAFQAFVTEYADVRTHALFQILPLAKLLQAAGFLGGRLPSEVGEFLNIPQPFNTYTYLNVFYMDWGVVGIVIGPFLFGLLGNWFFLRACARGKVWHIIGSAIIGYAAVASIGTNVLISTPVWEFALALGILAALARSRRDGAGTASGAWSADGA